MSEEKELKPCPFCGGEPDVVQYGMHETITCQNTSCGCTIEGYEDVNAREAWNNRYFHPRSFRDMQKILGQIKKQNVDLHYSLGIQHGFPSCCIKDFCSDIMNGDDPGNIRNINGSGFIPCKNHYQQIKAGEITLESLISIVSAPSLLEQVRVLRHALQLYFDCRNKAEDAVHFDYLLDENKWVSIASEALKITDKI